MSKKKIKNNPTNKNDVGRAYDNIADWFDEHRSKELFEKRYLDYVIAHLKPNATVLDIGCGTGEPIAQYFIHAGFAVTGVDASAKLLEIAKVRCPQMTLVLSDMRQLKLGKKFDCIIAWHSFFHLPVDDQRKMFSIFVEHLLPGGILLFTTGPAAGQVWSDNNGENLYHASLAPEEYKGILKQYNFTLLDYKISDPMCGDATVWVAQLK